MSDKAIGDVAEQVAAEGGAVVLVPNPDAEDAEREGTPPAPSADAHCLHCSEHERRIALLEAGLHEHTQRFTEHAALIDARALSEHEHAVDEDVRIIADELRALREEEVAPRRGVVQRGFLRRWLRGQSA